MSKNNLHQLVFQAAKEILASGQYPTIDLICEKLGLNSTEIESILSIKPQPKIKSELPTKKQEMIEALTLLAKLDITENQQADITTNQDENNETITDSEQVKDVDNNLDNHVKTMAERADKKAQYMAAAEVVLTQELYRYYRQTHRFSRPEIQKEVESALKDTEESWEDDIENFSPAVILKKYGKSTL
jgi:hypothetical protein